MMCSISARGVRRAVAAIGVALVLVLPTALSAVDTEATIEQGLRDIAQMRLDGRYAEAADRAREVLTFLWEHSATQPHEIADLQWQVSTLKHATSLSRREANELSRADSLGLAVEELSKAACLEEGLQAARLQLEILRRIFGEEHPEVSQSLHALARFYHKLGDSETAEPLYRQALEMRRQLLGEEHPAFAQSLNALGLLLTDIGDYTNAERFLGQALEAYRGIYDGEHIDVASCLNNIGILCRSRGDYAAAEDAYRQALAIDRRLLGEEHPNVALRLSSIANLLLERGDYVGSETLFRNALALQRSAGGDDHPRLALGLGNLASVLCRRGNHAVAEPLLRRALVLHKRAFGDDHPRIATTLSDLGVVLSARGDYAGAEQCFRDALNMNRRIFEGDHPDVSTALNNLALMLQMRGQYAEAERLLREAIIIKTNLLGYEHPSVATGLHNLAELLDDMGDRASSEKLMREALSMHRRLLGEEHPYVASDLQGLARVLSASGESEEAEEICREALSMRRRLLGEEHADVAESLMSLGRMARVRGDDEAARALLSDAARVYDSARRRAVGSGEFVVPSLRSPYADLAAAHLACGDSSAAWLAVEKFLARSLTDLLLSAERRTLSLQGSSREDSLRALCSSLENRLAVYQEAAQGDAGGETRARVEGVSRELMAAEAEWTALRAGLAITHVPGAEAAFSLERIQASLSPEIALVGWIDVKLNGCGHDSWGYVVRDSGPVFWVKLGAPARPGGFPSTLEEARSFRRRLSAPDSPLLALARDARAMWSNRLAPLMHHLDGADEIVVIPSGLMLGIPVGSMAGPDGVPIAERIAVSYAPSATVYAWLSERAEAYIERHHPTALLVGDPPFSRPQLYAMEDRRQAGGEMLAAAAPRTRSSISRSAIGGNDEALASLPRLRGTRQEVAAVAHSFPQAVVLLGSDASEQELTRLASQDSLRVFETIHFATHALVDNDRPERSALVLSLANLPDPLEAALRGDRVYDGLLTAKEIVEEWHLDADLVTLSACETGLGKEMLGEGYIGFAHAFFQSGARSLLVSLWDVDDAATSLLMRRFYENRVGRYSDERSGRIGVPMSKAEALQEAKCWLRTYTDDGGCRPYEHPCYWSAFMLLGHRG